MMRAIPLLIAALSSFPAHALIAPRVIPGHEQILRALIESPVTTKEQKGFLEDYCTMGVANEISLVFDCSAEGAEGMSTFRCKIGYADFIQERATTHHYGVDAVLSNLGGTLSVQSVKGYDFDESTPERR